jgi:hypothetical protein
MDYGCGVIDTSKPSDVVKKDFNMEELTWEFFYNNKNLFDITSVINEGTDLYNSSNKKLDIWTVNFNTTRLTNCMLKSVVKKFKSIKYNSFNIFDNSYPNQKFVLDETTDFRGVPVNIIDNTNQQIINFNTAFYFTEVDHSILKTPADNYGGLPSFNHSISIAYIL